jgi:putative transposase
VATPAVCLRKLQRNAFIENFHGRLRDELLDETMLASLSHVHEALAIWKDDDTHSRIQQGINVYRP